MLHCEGSLEADAANKLSALRVCKLTSFEQKTNMATREQYYQPVLTRYDDKREFHPQAFGVAPFYDRVVTYDQMFSL